MIANPKLKAYRYDPYEKKMTIEGYDHEQMLKNRKEAILKAKDAKIFGLIYGTLGRQGNPNVFATLENRIKALGKESLKFLTPEIDPEKLKRYTKIDAFIQVSYFFSTKIEVICYFCYK